MFLSDSKNSDDQNKELLRYFFGTYGLVIVIGIVTIVFGFLTDWIFTSPRNVPILLRQASITGIVAVGVALVIISGEIDLSIGSAVGLRDDGGTYDATEECLLLLYFLFILLP